jgi:hypothetical protein
MGLLSLWNNVSHSHNKSPLIYLYLDYYSIPLEKFGEYIALQCLK